MVTLIGSFAQANSSNEGAVQVDCDQTPPGATCPVPNSSKVGLFASTNPPVTSSDKGSSSSQGNQ